MRAHEVCLAFVNLHVTLRQLGFSRTQALDLPAFENEAGFDRIFDKKIVPGAPVGGYQRAAGRFAGFAGGFPGHLGSSVTIEKKVRDYTRNCLM